MLIILFQKNKIKMLSLMHNNIIPPDDRFPVLRG